MKARRLATIFLISALFALLAGAQPSRRQNKVGHTPGPDRPVFLEYAARYF